MKKRWTVDIVFPVYYDNIDILEDSTIEVLKHVKKIQDSYLFKIIISVNGPKSDKIIEKAIPIAAVAERAIGMGHPADQRAFFPQISGEGIDIFDNTA